MKYFFLDLKEIRDKTSKYYEFTFDSGQSNALTEIYSCATDTYSEVLLLSKADKDLRRHLFSAISNFTRSFSSDCQTQSMPVILSTFMQMLLNGPCMLNTQSYQKPSIAVQ
jgi:hypothetical protein